MQQNVEAVADNVSQNACLCQQAAYQTRTGK